MTRRDRRAYLGTSNRLLLAAVLTLAGTIGVFARQDATSPTVAIDDARLPPGPGREVIAKSCGLCHDMYRAASVRLTEDGWTAVLQDMMRRGAKLGDEDFQSALGYLAANFLGEADRPINLNTAAQIDFEMVLDLLRREAAAVIAFREKNGPFKAVTDLKRVPGLDYKKVEGKKDRVVVF